MSRYLPKVNENRDFYANVQRSIIHNQEVETIQMINE